MNDQSQETATAELISALYPQLCAGKGQKDTRRYSGGSYNTIDFPNIVALCQNLQPPCPKEDGYWILPSTYFAHDARDRHAQHERGSTALLWADIDKGNPTLEQVVTTVRSILGHGTTFLVHSSHSHNGLDVRKWHVLVPLANVIPPGQFFYEALATAFNDTLEAADLTVDRATQSITQLCYLPNPAYPAAFEFHHEPGEPLLLVGHRLDDSAHAVARKLIEDFKVRPARKEKGYRARDWFNLRYPAEVMLERWHFVSRNGGQDWHHPNQTTQSDGTRVWPDGGWSTRSETVKVMIGEWGDSFDIFCRLECQGNEARAQRCALAIQHGWKLGDDPEAVLQAAVDEGRKLWEGLKATLAREQDMQELPKPKSVADLVDDGVQDVVTNALPVGTTILSGRPKIGKSWIAINTAVAVALGWPLFQTPKFPTRSGDVIYYALETSERNTKRRFDTIQAPPEARKRIQVVLPDSITGQVPTLLGSLQASVEQWAASVESPRLVIIDIFEEVRTPIGKRDTKSHERADMLLLSALAHRLGIAILLLHHNRKAGGGVIDSVSGTYGLTGAASAVWNVGEATDGGKLLKIEGRDVPGDEILLRESYKATFVLAAQSEAAKISDQEQQILRAAVALHQSSNSITPKLLEEQMGYAIPIANIRTASSRLIEKMVFNRTTTKGIYELNHASMNVVTAITNYRIEHNMPVHEPNQPT